MSNQCCTCQNFIKDMPLGDMDCPCKCHQPCPACHPACSMPANNNLKCSCMCHQAPKCCKECDASRKSLPIGTCAYAYDCPCHQAPKDWESEYELLRAKFTIYNKQVGSYFLDDAPIKAFIHQVEQDAVAREREKAYSYFRAACYAADDGQDVVDAMKKYFAPDTNQANNN